MRDEHSVRSSSTRDFSTHKEEMEIMGSILDWQRDRHPGEEYEALPDDATRPTEVTIRPRYAEDTTTAWVSADIEDTVSLKDAR